MGCIIVVAVSIIVALVVFQVIASYVGTSTTTVSQVNNSRTAPTSGSCTDIQGFQEVIGTYQIVNGSSVVPTSNVSVRNIVGVDGQLTASLCTHDPIYSNKLVNVTATYGPDGYISDSSGRSVTGLIVLLSALAIFVFAIPNIREYLDI